jgi:hypothetical protein
VCPGIQIPAAPASSTTSIFGGKKQLQVNKIIIYFLI